MVDSAIVKVMLKNMGLNPEQLLGDAQKMVETVVSKMSSIEAELINQRVMLEEIHKNLCATRCEHGAIIGGPCAQCTVQAYTHLDLPITDAMSVQHGR